MAATTRNDTLSKLEIGRTDFVAEVGGGHDPFWRSDVIFDKYPFDNIHRSEDLADPVPVFIADANRIPLPDSGCDLLFASHIIEHLPEPDVFLDEVRRVSRRVYLEFPARNRELLFGWAMHSWLVEPRGTHLVFFRNNIPQMFGDLFHSHYDFLLDAWMMRRHAELNGHVYCASTDVTFEFATEGAFEHIAKTSRTGNARVDKAPPVEVDYTWRQLAALLTQKTLPRPLLDRLVQRARRQRRGAAAAVSHELLDRLACPACRAPALSLKGETVVCGSCERIYGQRGGLFDLDVMPDTETEAA